MQDAGKALQAPAPADPCPSRARAPTSPTARLNEASSPAQAPHAAELPAAGGAPGTTRKAAVGENGAVAKHAAQQDAVPPPARRPSSRAGAEQKQPSRQRQKAPCASAETDHVHAPYGVPAAQTSPAKSSHGPRLGHGSKALGGTSPRQQRAARTPQKAALPEHMAPSQPSGLSAAPAPAGDKDQPASVEHGAPDSGDVDSTGQEDGPAPETAFDEAPQRSAASLPAADTAPPDKSPHHQRHGKQLSPQQQKQQKQSLQKRGRKPRKARKAAVGADAVNAAEADVLSAASADLAVAGSGDEDLGLEDALAQELEARQPEDDDPAAQGELCMMLFWSSSLQHGVLLLHTVSSQG